MHKINFKQLLRLIFFLFVFVPLVSMGQEPLRTKRDSRKFPENFVIREQGPSYPECDFYFYPDKSLIKYGYFQTEAKIGKWMVQNDTVFMTFTKVMGKKGYGELVPNPHGINRPDEWVFYYNYEMDILEQEFFKIQNIENEPTQEKHLDDYIQVGEYLWADIYINIFASNFKKERFNFPPSGKYTFASMRALDSLELTKYTKQELRIMRNEIFARYGYIFKSEDLKQYFGSQRWYSPTRENVDKFITDLEKKNMVLILKQENLN